MRLLLDGVEGGQHNLFNGADRVLKVQLIGDDGSQIDCSAGTFTLEIYDTEQRTNAASYSLTITMDATFDVSGYGTCTLTETTIPNLTKGQRYFGFAKAVIATVTTFGDKPAYLNIK